MTRSWLTLIALLLAALCGPLASPVAGQTPINRYTVVPLSLSGPSTAYGINDAGQVVGQVVGQTSSRAFVWHGGATTDLGTLGGSYSTAYGINNSGQVVGAANTASGATHAFLWAAGTGMRNLGTLGGSGS